MGVFKSAEWAKLYRNGYLRSQVNYRGRLDSCVRIEKPNWPWTYLFSMHISGLFVMYQVTTCVWVCFWDLCSVLLIDFSRINKNSDSFSFVRSLHIWCVRSPNSFFKIFLAIDGPLHSQIYCKLSISISTKETCWASVWNFIKFRAWFGKNWLSLILSVPVHIYLGFL